MSRNTAIDSAHALIDRLQPEDTLVVAVCRDGDNTVLITRNLCPRSRKAITRRLERETSAPDRYPAED